MKFWGGIFCLGAGLNIILGWHGWPAVLGGSLNDPDSYMRLLRIDQGIAQGHLVNVVARDESGAGTMVEWSRLLDILLWVMAAPLAVFIGWHKALFAAGVALGPLGVGALGVALAFAARPFSEDMLLWAAAAAAAALPGLQSFALPGVVHYHILLLALIALSLGCVIRAWRGSNGLAFFGGVSGGFAIWLTPETMPFILMGFALLLWRWLRPGRGFGAVVVACAAGFFDVIGFGFAVDPPQGGYFVLETDRLSLVYVVLAVFVLIGGAVTWQLDKWPAQAARRITGGMLMAGLILTWIILFPGVIRGPYGIMPAAEMRHFFGVMRELQPLQGNAERVEFLAPGGLAFCYAIWRAVSVRFSSGFWLWLYLALCTLVTLVLADRFTLFICFPAAVAAALAPVMMSEASQRFGARPLAAMLARLGVVFALFIMPQLPAIAARPGMAAVAAAGAKPYPSCSLRHIGKFLAPYEGQVALAEAQYTPEILYRSQVLTVGSLYQHGLAGYFRAWDAWRVPPGSQVPAAVLATKARLILFCPQPGRYAVVRDLPPATLWDALETGNPPPWLRLAGRDDASGWEVFAKAPP